MTVVVPGTTYWGPDGKQISEAGFAELMKRWMVDGTRGEIKMTDTENARRVEAEAALTRLEEKHGRLLDAVQCVLSKFIVDEKMGYHTADREFAIDILYKAVDPNWSPHIFWKEVRYRGE